jgi:hypothetical protein
VQDAIEITEEVHRYRGIVMHERKAWLVGQVRVVAGRPGEEIVQSDDFVSVGQEAVDKM